MSVKTTGAEFNAFMADKAVWQEGYWYDDAYVLVNGAADDLEYSFEGGDALPADAKVIVETGSFYTGPDFSSTFYPLTSILRKWLKARQVTTIVVEVPNEQVEQFRADMAERKWRLPR